MSDERRKYYRTSLCLPIEVQGYICEHGSFQERTETLNLSPLGASFRLGFSVSVDDILLLKIPMPKQMRLYETDNNDYQIYAQVRRTKQRADGYLMVGVAFISKDPPDLELNPVIKQPSSHGHQIYATRPLSSELLSQQQLQNFSPPYESPSAVLKHPTIAQSHLYNNDRYEPRAKLRLSLSIRGYDRFGHHFVELIQTEDVSKHGFCFGITNHELDAHTILEIAGFQGKFNAQGEVRHVTYSPTDRRYRIGIRLLGEPSHWIVK